MANNSGAETLVGTSIAFGVLTVIVLALRLSTRFFIVNAVGGDDILIIIACLLAWAFIIVSILSTQHGLGGHIDQMKDEDWEPYLKIVWSSSIFYNACLGFIKCSILTLYMRLGERTLRRNAMIMMGVVACQAGGNVMACIFQCTPISKVWDLTLTTGHCVNINAFYLANAAVNITTDILTYVLPIPLVRNLQVSRKQKIGVGVMLCLGFFTCLSSIIRITFVPRLLVSKDPTFDITPAMYWSVIETNVGILAASIPSFKPLARRFLPVLVGDSSKSRSNKENQKGYINSSTSRSGFMELDDVKNNGRGKNGNVTEVDADSLDKIYGNGISTNCGVESLNGDGERDGKGGGNAMMTREYASSEEMIIPPPGRIMAQTQVTRTVTGL